MKSIMITLKCLTNLHAGNGDVNYNIIDNEVERDPVTRYPNINASGVKGALRAFLEKEHKSECTEWFGAEGDAKPGKLKILGASLLALPGRATQGPRAFYLLATPTLIGAYKEACSIFDIPMVVSDAGKTESAAAAEGINLAKKYSLYSDEIYEVKDEEFRNIALPVIARNQLDDGISRNLWYEEVVPHESIMYFPVLADDSDKALLDSFMSAIRDKVIQFGGNASIGYGLCKIRIEGGKA